MAVAAAQAATETAEQGRLTPFNSKDEVTRDVGVIQILTSHFFLSANLVT